MRKLIMTLATVVVALTGAAQVPQVIAHRGYWKTDGSAQNSIRALVKADSIGCYGSEFDVWLSRDGKLVVNHDPTYDGKGMEQSTFAELTALTLDNGESLPSLKQYLEEGKKCKTRLVLELKTHSMPEHETEAVQKIVGMVHKMGLDDRTDYISFSLHACREFVRLAPKGTQVYYLNGDLTPEQLKAEGFAGPDYHLSVLKKHPEWIEECHSMGLKVNSWTVDKESGMKWLIDHNVDFITTNRPETLQQLLRDAAGK